MKTGFYCLTLFLLIGKIAFATSCTNDSDYAVLFKNYKNSNSDFIAGKGIVLEKNIDFVKLKVISTFYLGSSLPNDSIIIVRNAMKKNNMFDGLQDRVIYAKDLLIDTAVFLVPKIIQKFYNTDVVGDYRIRPDTLDNFMTGSQFCIGQFELSVKKDTIVRPVVEISGGSPNYNGIKYTDKQFRIYIGLLTGFTSLDVNPVINLFPNPSNDLLHLNISNSCFSCLVEILDAQSKLVFAKTYEDAPLDISKLNSGLYYFLLKDTNGTMVKSKFVKN